MSNGIERRIQFQGKERVRQRLGRLKPLIQFLPLGGIGSDLHALFKQVDQFARFEQRFVNFLVEREINIRDYFLLRAGLRGTIRRRANKWIEVGEERRPGLVL